MKEDELITQVSVPSPPRAGSGGAYLKLERKAGDFATVAVAAQLTLEERKDGDLLQLRRDRADGPWAEEPPREEAERSLVGRKVTKEAIAEASSSGCEECSPTDDPLRGSAKYKREMAGLFTRRALELALRPGARRREEEARDDDRSRSISVSVKVNGKEQSAEVEPRLLLVDFICATCSGLTGTHVGCDTTNCGACTILLDGRVCESPARCSRSRPTEGRSRRSRGCRPPTGSSTRSRRRSGRTTASSAGSAPPGW